MRVHDAATTSAIPGGAPRREQVSWFFYDWANSAFATTVAAVLMGPYLTAVTRAAADAGGFVYPLGVPVTAGAYFPFVVSLSVLLQVFVLPILGAVADLTQRKKEMLGFFAYLGAFATMAMFLVQGSDYLLGGLLFLVANLSFGASVVFYNAFLPEIASPDQRDRISSYGWAMGYLGGGLLLAANLALVSNAERLGLTSGLAVRLSLASAGVWWAVFTLVPLVGLRNRRRVRTLPAGGQVLTAGFRQLAHTIREARQYPQTLLYLAAYLLYNDGIQAVLALSTQFGQEELGLTVSTLTSAIMLAQVVGFLGALAWGYAVRWTGAKRALLVMLVVWIGVVTYAYAFLATATQFFVLAAVIAVVLGGSQALSRSLFAQMIPRGREAEYFSLYEVSERGTSWLAPLLFGLALQLTGSYRASILSLIVFFVAGLLLLLPVNVRKAALEAGNTPPERV